MYIDIVKECKCIARGDKWREKEEDYEKEREVGRYRDTIMCIR